MYVNGSFRKTAACCSALLPTHTLHVTTSSRYPQREEGAPAVNVQNSFAAGTIDHSCRAAVCRSLPVCVDCRLAALFESGADTPRYVQSYRPSLQVCLSLSTVSHCCTEHAGGMQPTQGSNMMHMLVHVRTPHVVCHSIATLAPVHCSRPFDEGERLEHTPVPYPMLMNSARSAELQCDRSPNLQCLVTLAHASILPTIKALFEMNGDQGLALFAEVWPDPMLNRRGIYAARSNGVKRRVAAGPAANVGAPHELSCSTSGKSTI
jgi:hypothetical protein